MQHLGLISRKQKTVTVGQSVDCNASTHSSAPPHCARCTLYCLHTLLLKSSLCLCLCVLVFASVFVFEFVCRWVLRLDSTLHTLHSIPYCPGLCFYEWNKSNCLGRLHHSVTLVAPIRILSMGREWMTAYRLPPWALSFDERTATHNRGFPSRMKDCPLRENWAITGTYTPNHTYART